MPLDVPLPALGIWSGSLAKNEGRRDDYTVTIPQPGMYRVLASAFTRSSEHIHDDHGQLIQNEAHAEIWLWVDEQGGRVLDRFDPGLFPKGSVVAEGPLRFRQNRSTPATPMADDMVAASSTCPAESTCGQVYYLNKTTGASVPLAGASVNVDFYDAYTGNLAGGSGDVTDAQGWFEVSCPAYNEDGKLQVLARNLDFEIKPTVVATTWIDYSDCGWTMNVGADADPSHVFSNFRAVKARADGIFQYTRPKIVVNIDYNGCEGIFGFGSKTSCYSRLHDEITIISGPDDFGNPDHVWGSLGYYVAGHEYGHAYHYTAAGGYDGPSNCSSHSYDKVTSLSCALVEGFADFFSVAVGGDYYYDVVEHNYGWQSGRDNSAVEGVVAAFLYDLIDSNADISADGVQYPGAYVAEIFRTGEVERSPGDWFRPADGIDYLIYNFEDQVDPAVTASSVYFTYRSSDPINQRNSAIKPGTWSASAVRSLWRSVIYQE